ncbi:hypothetical protein A3Q56_08087, partial [Intoshia linei]
MLAENTYSPCLLPKGIFRGHTSSNQAQSCKIEITETSIKITNCINKTFKCVYTFQDNTDWTYIILEELKTNNYTKFTSMNYYCANLYKNETNHRIELYQESSNRISCYKDDFFEFKKIYMYMNITDYLLCNHITCRENEVCDTVSKSCKCKKGYISPDCIKYDESLCNIIKCESNKYCIQQHNTTMCICQDGYGGDNCESINSCLYKKCGKNEYCVDSDGDSKTVCFCNGVIIDEKENCIKKVTCTIHYCLNGGECNKNSDGCNCPIYYVGDRCENYKQ